jgi:hypothetical protein
MRFELVWRCVLHGNHVTRVVNGKGAVILSLNMGCASRVCACYTAKSPDIGYTRKPCNT